MPVLIKNPIERNIIRQLIHLFHIFPPIVRVVRNFIFIFNYPDYKIDNYPVADKVLYERIAITAMRDIEYDQEYLEQILEAFRKISLYRDELR